MHAGSMRWRRNGSVMGAAILVVALSGAFGRAAAQDGVTIRTDVQSKGPAWAGLLFMDKENDSAPYLVTESVDPASPAHKAGLMAGDTILSFSGVSIRTVVSNPKRFKPGDKVVVKFRRNGVKELPVTLGVRPARWLLTPSEINMTVNVNDLLAAADVLPPFAGGSFGGCNDLPVAGAEVTILNADLATALNVNKVSGLLVLQVAPGTPATKAGLKGGDILVRADSITLDTPMALAKTMRASKGKEVALIVQRGSETRTVKLQW